MLIKIIFLIFISVAAPEELTEIKSYGGYKVIRLIPQTTEQVEFIQKLQDLFIDLDFWTSAKTINQTSDVMVPPKVASQFANTIQTLKIPRFTLIDNVNELINEENKANKIPTKLAQSSIALSWTKYHRLNDIYRYLSNLAYRNPNIAKIINIGESFEGRKLKVIKIGTATGRTKPAIWIDAGIHAREWISPATALYIIDQLINNYTNNKALVDQLDWYILPVVNPDGYEYTHTNARLWRKTRSSIRNSYCVGVDGNRNFGYNWNQGGSSSNPCSNTYRGPSAFSEPETRAVAKFILSNSYQFKFFLTIHSYSQVLLLPWGFTTNLPNDYLDLENLGKKAANVLKSVYGTTYNVGNSYTIMYPTSGSSLDWAKGIAGIKYSYTIELRDKGRYGFMLPPSQIQPTGLETFEAIKVFGNFVAAL